MEPQGSGHSCLGLIAELWWRPGSRGEEVGRGPGSGMHFSPHLLCFPASHPEARRCRLGQFPVNVVVTYTQGGAPTPTVPFFVPGAAVMWQGQHRRAAPRRPRASGRPDAGAP